MNEIIETTDKTPIEVALEVDDEGFTTAKKLYEWLELDPTQYARWVKDNILNNPYADETEYSTLMSKTSKQGGRPTQDYKIHVTLAKKLAMTSRSPKGEEARNYFIGCEQVLKRLEEQKRKTELERVKGMAIRHAMTNTIKDCKEDDRMHGHAYSTYTNMIYKVIFGKDAKGLREEYNVSKKENLRDCFSREELAQIQNAEMLVSSLMGYGWGYHEIKNFIENHAGKYIDITAEA